MSFAGAGLSVICHPLGQDGLINMSSASAGLSVYMLFARAGWSYNYVIRWGKIVCLYAIRKGRVVF